MLENSIESGRKTWHLFICAKSVATYMTYYSIECLLRLRIIEKLFILVDFFFEPKPPDSMYEIQKHFMENYFMENWTILLRTKSFSEHEITQFI